MNFKAAFAIFELCVPWRKGNRASTFGSSFSFTSKLPYKSRIFAFPRRGGKRRKGRETIWGRFIICTYIYMYVEIYTYGYVTWYCKLRCPRGKETSPGENSRFLYPTLLFFSPSKVSPQALACIIGVNTFVLRRREIKSKREEKEKKGIIREERGLCTFPCPLRGRLAVATKLLLNPLDFSEIYSLSYVQSYRTSRSGRRTTKREKAGKLGSPRKRG